MAVRITDLGVRTSPDGTETLAVDYTVSGGPGDDTIVTQQLPISTLLQYMQDNLTFAVNTDTQLTEAQVQAFIDSAYINGLTIDADTVGGFTVGTNVPADAVFTDTDTNTQLTSATILAVLNGATGSIDADLLGNAVGTEVVAVPEFPTTGNEEGDIIFINGLGTNEGVSPSEGVYVWTSGAPKEIANTDASQVLLDDASFSDPGTNLEFTDSRVSTTLDSGNGRVLIDTSGITTVTDTTKADTDLQNIDDDLTAEEQAIVRTRIGAASSASSGLTENDADARYVRHTASQGLNATQQGNARDNIGAGTSDLVIGTSGTTALAGNTDVDNVDINQYDTVTTAADDDFIVIQDASDSNANKKITKSNFQTGLGGGGGGLSTTNLSSGDVPYFDGTDGQPSGISISASTVRGINVSRFSELTSSGTVLVDPAASITSGRVGLRDASNVHITTWVDIATVLSDIDSFIDTSANALQIDDELLLYEDISNWCIVVATAATVLDGVSDEATTVMTPVNFEGSPPPSTGSLVMYRDGTSTVRGVTSFPGGVGISSELTLSSPGFDLPTGDNTTNLAINADGNIVEGSAGGGGSADLSVLNTDPLRFSASVAVAQGAAMTWEDASGISFNGNADDVQHSSLFDDITTASETGSDTGRFQEVLIEEVPFATYDDWTSSDVDIQSGFIALQELSELGRIIICRIEEGSTINGSTVSFRDVTLDVIEERAPTSVSNQVTRYTVTNGNAAEITSGSSWNVIEIADARRTLTHLVQEDDETVSVTTDIDVQRQLSVNTISASRTTGDDQFAVLTDEGEFTTTTIPVDGTATLVFGNDNVTINTIFQNLGNGQGQLFCTLVDTSIAVDSTITENDVGNIYRVVDAGIGGISIVRATLTDGTAFTEATGANLQFTFFTAIQTTADRTVFTDDVQFQGEVFGLNISPLDFPSPVYRVGLPSEVPQNPREGDLIYTTAAIGDDEGYTQFEASGTPITFTSDDNYDADNDNFGEITRIDFNVDVSQITVPATVVDITGATVGWTTALGAQANSGSGTPATSDDPGIIIGYNEDGTVEYRFGAPAGSASDARIWLEGDFQNLTDEPIYFLDEAETRRFNLEPNVFYIYDGTSWVQATERDIDLAYYHAHTSITQEPFVQRNNSINSSHTFRGGDTHTGSLSHNIGTYSTPSTGTFTVRLSGYLTQFGGFVRGSYQVRLVSVSGSATNDDHIVLGRTSASSIDSAGGIFFGDTTVTIGTDVDASTDYYLQVDATNLVDGESESFSFVAHFDHEEGGVVATPEFDTYVNGLITSAGTGFAGLTGDVTAGPDGVTSIADDTIGLDELSATGTASATTFLRGDNTWATPAGGSGGSGLSTANLSDGDIPYFNGADGQPSGLTVSLDRGLFLFSDGDGTATLAATTTDYDHSSRVPLDGTPLLTDSGTDYYASLNGTTVTFSNSATPQTAGSFSIIAGNVEHVANATGTVTSSEVTLTVGQFSEIALWFTANGFLSGGSRYLTADQFIAFKSSSIPEVASRDFKAYGFDDAFSSTEDTFRFAVPAGVTSDTTANTLGGDSRVSIRFISAFDSDVTYDLNNKAISGVATEGTLTGGNRVELDLTQAEINAIAPLGEYDATLSSTVFSENQIQLYLVDSVPTNAGVSVVNASSNIVVDGTVTAANVGAIWKGENASFDIAQSAGTQSDQVPTITEAISVGGLATNTTPTGGITVGPGTYKIKTQIHASTDSGTAGGNDRAAITVGASVGGTFSYGSNGYFRNQLDLLETAGSVFSDVIQVAEGATQTIELAYNIVTQSAADITYTVASGDAKLIVERIA